MSRATFIALLVLAGAPKAPTDFARRGELQGWSRSLDGGSCSIAFHRQGEACVITGLSDETHTTENGVADSEVSDMVYSEVLGCGARSHVCGGAFTCDCSAPDAAPRERLRAK